MANMLHAGSHAFICGIDLLPVPTGSSHPYLIPACMHRVPTVHAGSHACMDQVHTCTIPMCACTGSPHMNACTQDSHACTHQVPTHAHRTPMRARTRSPCTNAHTQDPHACTHRVPTHAHRIPMHAHTGSPHTHTGSPCVHAPGLHTHACTALILCPCTLDPHTHPTPMPDPHVCMHTPDPRMHACTRSHHACRHAGFPCVYAPGHHARTHTWTLHAQCILGLLL